MKNESWKTICASMKAAFLNCGAIQFDSFEELATIIRKASHARRTDRSVCILVSVLVNEGILDRHTPDEKTIFWTLSVAMRRELRTIIGTAAFDRLAQ